MGQYLHLPFAVLLLSTVGWTTLFSLTNNPGLRGFRNLGILASYVAGVVFLFVVGWRLALATWALFGVAGGLFYVAWEILERRRAAGSPQNPRVGLAPLIHGLFLWPIMVPEAVEYALADLGILHVPPSAPTRGPGEPGAAPSGDSATSSAGSSVTQEASAVR